MAQQEHNKAAEQHESAAKSHRQAAEQHGKNDHAKGQQHAGEARTIRSIGENAQPKLAAWLAKWPTPSPQNSAWRCRSL